MNKKLKIGLLVGIPVAIGGYLIYKQFQPAKKNAVAPVNNNNPNPVKPKPVLQPSGSSTSNSNPCGFPLKKGSGIPTPCELVKQLQYALNNIPHTQVAGETGCENKCSLKPLVVDGQFGSKTLALLQDTWGGGITSIDNQSDLDKLYTWVIVDPAELQAAENPYVIASDNPVIVDNGVNDFPIGLPSAF